MTIGEKIYEERTSKGLSQKDLANLIGVSQSSVNFWENGKRQPKLEQLQKIANALNVPLLELSPILDTVQEGCYYAEELLGIEQSSTIFLRFSALLKPLMESKGVSSEQLAETVGLPVAVIQGYIQEKFFPKFETIDKIAKALDVPSSSLTPAISIKDEEILLSSEIFPTSRTYSLAEYSDMRNKPLTAYFDAWLLASECDYMAVIKNGVKGYFFCVSDPEDFWGKKCFFVTKKQFEIIRNFSTGYIRHLIMSFGEQNTNASENAKTNAIHIPASAPES